MTKMTPGQSTVESHRTDFEDDLEFLRELELSPLPDREAIAELERVMLERFVDCCQDPAYSRGVLGEIAGLLKEAGVVR
jgi:hypothetical protein